MQWHILLTKNFTKQNNFVNFLEFAIHKFQKFMDLENFFQFASFI